jgi:hypothetical protein
MFHILHSAEAAFSATRVEIRSDSTINYHKKFLNCFNTKLIKISLPIASGLLISGFITSVTAKETPSLEFAFASTTVKITAMPDAVNIPVEWAYTNQLNEPLMVEKFEESCGCLSGELEQQVHKTGESGVIRASFTPGSSRGVIRKSLHVRFVGHEKPVELIVEAKIASPVQLSTQQIIWKSSESSTAKTIDVTTGTETDFSITALFGLPENLFKVTQETITPLRQYRIYITPAAESNGIHTLQVRTDSKDPRDQIQAVFLSIEK